MSDKPRDKTLETRRLLELAAKAVGYTVVRPSDDENGLLLLGGQSVWCPHLDDGDSRRLEVALCLRVLWTAPDALVKQVGAGRWSTNPADDTVHYEFAGDDPAAATRLAVLRAAAAIGEAMMESGS